MKKLNFLFCFILTLILTSFSINAAESNSTVKVGLSNYTNLENINIMIEIYIKRFTLNVKDIKF